MSGGNIFFTAGPGHIGAAQNTFAAAYASFFIPRRSVIHFPQGTGRLSGTGADTGAATDAPVRLQPGERHTHNSEIVHPHLSTVIGAAGKSDLKIQIVGKYSLFDPAGERGCVITGIRADPVTDTCTDITGAGSRIAGFRAVQADISLSYFTVSAFPKAPADTVNRLRSVQKLHLSPSLPCGSSDPRSRRRYR